MCMHTAGFEQSACYMRAPDSKQQGFILSLNFCFGCAAKTACAQSKKWPLTLHCKDSDCVICCEDSNLLQSLHAQLSSSWDYVYDAEPHFQFWTSLA